VVILDIQIRSPVRARDRPSAAMHLYCASIGRVPSSAPPGDFELQVRANCERSALKVPFHPTADTSYATHTADGE